MKQPLIIMLCFLCWVLSAKAVPLQDDVVIWDQRPIHVHLPVDQERLIRFPESVLFNSPSPNSKLTQDDIEVFNLNQTLYITAKKTFHAQRVLVTLKESGEVIILDIKASQAGDRSPLTIELPQALTHSTRQQATSETVSYVQLMRYVLQQFYAPKRVLTHDPTITRRAMKTPRTVPFIVRHPCVTAMPVAQWQSLKASLFVTAISLNNHLPDPVSINKQRFCGQWLAATIYPNDQLAPKGLEGDSTLLLLVSHQPFDVAMEVCYGG